MTQPLAAIGASAGGLKAFSQLLRHLPADTGMAFVFVQHLDPKHESNLSEILAKMSAIPVQQAADGMKIEPNHVYVIPADADLEIAGQCLRTTPRESPPGLHKPIDLFLKSLANECGSRAIAVILSGAGTDGAAGLQAVKTAGGVTFAQTPSSAEFDGMPRSAIATECVDFVLPPEAIAGELVKLSRHSYLVEDDDGSNPSAGPNHDVGPILKLLSDSTDIDFSLYRENMVRRRILRRLALLNIDGIDEYRKQIENDPLELANLHRDLLIGVTQFFRDPESFEKLKRLVFPRMLQGRTDGDPIRVWVAGCATGEEAYSIAILLHEYLGEANRPCKVQVFASDINDAAVEKARRGQYRGTIASDVSPERLEKYFLKTDGGYKVTNPLRELCVFSRHDLTRDPPFSRIDLISCRNVLIFFGSVRKNVIATLHYALKPGGFLVLGPSETASSSGFATIEGADGIYAKTQPAEKWYSAAGAPGRRATAGVYQKIRLQPVNPPAKEIDLRKQAERTLLSKYSGTGVVVDENLDVLEIIGRPTPHLMLPVGKVSSNLLRLIPNTRLFLEVEKLIREARETSRPARKSRVPCQGEAAADSVNIEVIPLASAQARALLILLEPASDAARTDRGPDDLQQRDPEIARLSQELADAHSRLLTIMETQHATNYENQNVIRDAMSANEELQSLNEELETSKEELQSTNEELATVNAQLVANNAALGEARDFAMLVIDAVASPLAVLNTDLRLQSANPAFYRMFQISPSDAEGRFFYSLCDGAWDIPAVRDMLERVLPDKKSIQDFEVEHDFPLIGKRVLVLNARRLDTLQQILLGIEDVTERQERADAALRESEGRFRSMADTAPVMIWVAGVDMGCTFFNKPWLTFTGRTMEQELGNGWTEGLHPDDLDRCLSIYTYSFAERRPFQMEYRMRRADGEYRWLLDSGVPRFERGDVFVGYIGSCLDITDFKRRHEESLARQQLEGVGTLAGGIAHDFNNLLGGVLSQAELALAELAAGSPPEEEIRRIQTAAIRGSEIVRQLMIYAGKENEAVELVDVSRVTEEMLGLLNLSVSTHATLEIDLGKDLPPVRANASNVRQVVMNLITNASEAVGDSGGVIRVSTREVSVDPDSPLAASDRLAAGDYLQLEVSDNGRGMDPEMQARVFEPFFTTKSAGRGLGLAVVQGIVRHLRGTIRLTTAPGAGTAFQILLPAAPEGSPAVQEPPVETSPLNPSQGGAVLIVEDEELLLKATGKMIRKAGFSAIEAKDGSAGLDAIRDPQNRIDLLLLDLTLPGTPSREVMEEANRLRPGMKVIVTSAYNEAMAAASLGRVVDHFIRKPYRLGELVALIRQVISS